MNIKPIFDSHHMGDEVIVTNSSLKNSNMFKEYMKLKDHFSEHLKAFTITFSDFLEIDTPALKVILLNRLINRRLWEETHEFEFSFTEKERTELWDFEKKLFDQVRDSLDSNSIGTYIASLPTIEAIDEFAAKWNALETFLTPTIEMERLIWALPRKFTESEDFGKRIQHITKNIKISNGGANTKAELEASAKVKAYILDDSDLNLETVQIASVRSMLVLANRVKLDDGQFERAMAVLDFFASKLGNHWQASNTIGFNTNTIDSHDRMKRYDEYLKKYAKNANPIEKTWDVVGKNMTVKLLGDSFKAEVKDKGAITVFGLTAITEFYDLPIVSSNDFFNQADLRKACDAYIKKHGFLMLDATHRHLGKMISWEEIDNVLLDYAEDNLVIASRLMFRLGCRKVSGRVEHKLTQKGLKLSLCG